MEKWKPIPEYEGIYEASNLGRIRTSAEKVTYTERHGERHWKQRVLKGRGNNAQTGYRVTLWKNGKPKEFLFARAVAMAWVSGYSPELTVNHIDGNRFNNVASNLEWVTLSENIKHGFRTGLYNSILTPVAITDGRETLFFNSMAAASRYLGKNNGYVSGALIKHSTVADDSGKEYVAVCL